MPPFDRLSVVINASNNTSHLEIATHAHSSFNMRWETNYIQNTVYYKNLLSEEVDNSDDTQHEACVSTKLFRKVLQCTQIESAYGICGISLFHITDVHIVLSYS